MPAEPEPEPEQHPPAEGIAHDNTQQIAERRPPIIVVHEAEALVGKHRADQQGPYRESDHRLSSQVGLRMPVQVSRRMLFRASYGQFAAPEFLSMRQADSFTATNAEAGTVLSWLRMMSVQRESMVPQICQFGPWSATNIP